jgi:hypothetical protein
MKVTANQLKDLVTIRDNCKDELDYKTKNYEEHMADAVARILYHSAHAKWSLINNIIDNVDIVQHVD